MNDQDHSPAEPVEDDKGNPEGFAALARRLNKVHPDRLRPISRQLVHKWSLYRHHNGFPEPTGYIGTGTGRPVFDWVAVVNWYIEYRRNHGNEDLARKAISSQKPVETVGARSDQIAA